MIKIVVKLGLLFKHSQFNADEFGHAKSLQSKFKMTVLTMISYHDVAFTYDQAFLTERLAECKVKAI